MTKVILIAGKAQHGKDTLAEFLKKGLENKGKSVQIVHFADYLKFICSKYFSWDGKKDARGREILQKVGTDKIRSKVADFWVWPVINLIEVAFDDYNYVIIPDTRFKNEVYEMKATFETIYLKIFRPDFDNGLTLEQQNHPSEIDLDGEMADISIYNSKGLTDLLETAATLTKEIMKWKTV